MLACLPRSSRHEQRHRVHIERETDGGGEEGGKRRIRWEEKRGSREMGEEGKIDTHSIRFMHVPLSNGVGAKLSTSRSI